MKTRWLLACIAFVAMVLGTGCGACPPPPLAADRTDHTMQVADEHGIIEIACSCHPDEPVATCVSVDPYLCALSEDEVDLEEDTGRMGITAVELGELREACAEVRGTSER